MTNKILLLITLATASACSMFTKSPQKPAPTIYLFANNITEQSLYNDLVVISHDSLEGRETGTIGEQKAARYISKRYTEMGLKPVGDNNSYFQHFDLIQPTVKEISYRVLNASDNSVVDASTHSADEIGNFVTLFGGSDPLSGPIVFVGAGMRNEEEGINQYPENVDGKWLLVAYQRGKTDMRFLQGTFSEGALGAILINDTDVNDFTEEAESRQENFGQGGRLSLKYLQKDDAGASPAFNRINPELATKLLGLNNLAALSKLEEQLAADPAAFQAKKLDYILEHNPTVNENTVTSQNIVAFLEGSDPDLKHEVVVLSSHYDHVGITRPDSTGDALNNGADDDGSGTVATIQTAQAMSEAKAAGVGPKRSVLFLNVSGEEKGLLGSRYYSDHPIFSMENTVADINIDMIGRVDPEHEGKDSSYVYIIGGEIISSHLDSLTVMANAMGPNLDLSKRYNDLDDPNQFYRRSDHWNFGRLGVPFVFFFNGVHPDYHRPSDEIDKITFGPYLQRTHLVYNLTAILANSADRPVVDNQEFIEKTQTQAR